MNIGGRAIPRPVAAVSGLMLVAVALLSGIQPNSRLTMVVNNVSWVGAAGIATVALVAAVRRTAPMWRLGWSLLAATTGLWTVANVGWAGFALLGKEVPNTSWIDLFYIPAQLTALAACIVLLRPLLAKGRRWRAALDGVLVSISLAYLSATTLLADPGFGLGGLDWVVAWTYPLTDVVIVAVAIVVLSRAPRNVLPVAGPAALGVVAIGLADSLWAFYFVSFEVLGNAVTCVLYVVGYLALGFAAASRRAVPGVDSRRLPLVLRQLPMVVVFGAVLDLIAHQVAGPYPEILGVGVVVLLFVRQVITVVENQRLRRSLESAVVERTAELAESESLVRAVTEIISDAVLVLDVEGNTRYESDRLLGMHGAFEDTRHLMERLQDIVHPDDLAAVLRFGAEVAAEVGSTRTLQARTLTDGAAWAHTEITMANRLHDPVIRGLLLASRDVSAQHVLEEQLRRQAYTDALTGLPNRAQLRDIVSACLDRGAAPAVILLDLDEFKSVNDSLGHAVGDQLLVAVGRRLGATVGDDGVLARLSGDEFAVAVEAGEHAAVQVAERMAGALRAPIEAGEYRLGCRASFGVAGIGDDADALLRNADLAMYQAKGDGKGRVRTYASRLHTDLMRRIELEEALSHAIERDELRVVYQPVVDLMTGQVLGAEALLRWHRGNDVIVDPAEFVPVAEATGLIGPIGRWVLHQACIAAAGWDETSSGRPPMIAVNVSPRQVLERDIVVDVEDALRSSGLAPEQLTIELTESALMEHSDAVLDAMHGLKALGVRLSIDDFGTGYSSLGRLQFLPVDEVKIDKSFVGDPVAMPVVEAVLALAASLHLSVVVEGVETQAQLFALRARGCRRAQGFLFGRPMSPSALGALLFKPRVIDDRVLDLPV